VISRPKLRVHPTCSSPTLRDDAPPTRAHRWQIEDWLAVEVIEVRADDSRFFQPDAVVTDEIRHAARWIDLVVRTVRATCLCRDDLDSALQPFSITTIRAMRA